MDGFIALKNQESIGGESQLTVLLVLLSLPTT